MEKRAAILDAAMALFPARGYDGASVEAIAQAAGVSKLTVYSHFADKEALFGAA
jgi:TetR/AcrR family transcriptional repressor of mexJK operon